MKKKCKCTNKHFVKNNETNCEIKTIKINLGTDVDIITKRMSTIVQFG